MEPTRQQQPVADNPDHEFQVHTPQKSSRLALAGIVLFLLLLAAAAVLIVYQKVNGNTAPQTQNVLLKPDGN